MKDYKLLLVLISIILLFSCTKEESFKETCYDIGFEISGDSSTIDSITFYLGATNQHVSRVYSNKIIPYSESVEFCEEDFDYNLRCYDMDTSLVLTLRIFRDDILIKQKTGSLNNYSGPYPFIEFAGGIND